MSVIVGPRAARCARRPEAGASPRAVRDARARQRLQQAVQEIGPRGRRCASVNTIRTATRRFTTPSCAWRSHFRMRYLLVDGQGNFGSVDGDTPAAMRYTEVRMSRIAERNAGRYRQGNRRFHAELRRIARREPAVLPTRIPNLLVNGSSGIAVGMATNIPPHNLSEIIRPALR